MKRVQVFIGCDRTWADSRTLVPADETVYLAFGPDPDHLHVRELDLAAPWAKGLREYLQPFLDAGHAPGEMDVPGGTDNARGTGTRKKAGHTGSQENVSYHRQMRAWADAAGYAVRGKPGYQKLAKGGYYYSPALKRDYAAYLASIAEVTDEREPAPA